MVDIPTVKTVEQAINDSLFNSGLREADFLIPLFQNFFSPNLTYNDVRNQQFLQERKDKVEQYGETITEGTTIVAKGELITAAVHEQIVAYQKKYKDLYHLFCA